MKNRLPNTTFHVKNKLNINNQQVKTIARYLSVHEKLVDTRLSYLQTIVGIYSLTSQYKIGQQVAVHTQVITDNVIY